MVEAVGAGVAHVAAGDRVAFCFVPSCGTCAQCRAGHANLCVPAGEHNSRGSARRTAPRACRSPDGEPVKHFLSVACFAERCVVPAAAAVPLPAGLPLWQAALVGCSVVTGLGAVRNVARVQPGQSVAVIGCGGVGLQAIAGARLAGAGPRGGDRPRPWQAGARAAAGRDRHGAGGRRPRPRGAGAGAVRRRRRRPRDRGGRPPGHDPPGVRHDPAGRHGGGGRYRSQRGSRWRCRRSTS